MHFTGFEDFVAQREARPLVGVVWHELDVERGARRYDRRGGDVAAVLPQHVSGLRVPIVDLHVVVPAEDKQIFMNDVGVCGTLWKSFLSEGCHHSSNELQQKTLAHYRWRRRKIIDCIWQHRKRTPFVKFCNCTVIEWLYTLNAIYAVTVHGTSFYGLYCHEYKLTCSLSDCTRGTAVSTFHSQ